MPASLHLPRSSVRSVHRLTLSGIAQASIPVAPADDDDFDLLQSVEIMLRGAQHQPHAKAYQVVGDSMDDGSRGAIQHGSIILVNSRDEFNVTRPCLFETPNGYIIKVRDTIDGRWVLKSLNESVPLITDMAGIIPRGCVYGVYEGAYKVRFL